MTITRKIIVCFACLTAGLCSPDARAQAQPQSLNDALVQAYESNKQLKAAREGQKATDESLPQAKAYWFRPQVSLTVDRTHEYIYTKDDIKTSTSTTTNHITENVGVKSVEVEVEVPLYRGGRTVAGIDEANADILSGQAGLVSTEQTILTNAVSAYADVVYYRAVKAIQIAVVKSYEERVKDIRAQVQAQRRTVGDLALFRNSLAQAKGDLAATRGELAAAEATYKAIVGTQPGPLDANASLHPLPASANDALDVALSENPDLKSAFHDIDSNDAAVRSAEGELLPEVNFIATATREGERTHYNRDVSSDYKQNDGILDVYVGVELTMNLYDGGGYYSAIREAKRKAAQARFTHAYTRENLKGTVTAAWARLEAAAGEIESAKESLDALKDAEAAMEFEFARGDATSNDLIDIIDKRRTAEETLQSTYRTRLNAQATLMSAIGRLNVVAMDLPANRYDPNVHLNEVKDKWIGLGN